MTLIFNYIVAAFEMLAVLVLVVGFIISGVLAYKKLQTSKDAQAAFGVLRKALGGALLLGLEVMVAGDIIRTIFMPGLQEALTLGLVVIIRTILSMSIQIEIDGVLPWRRALTTNGAQIIAAAAKNEAE